MKDTNVTTLVLLNISVVRERGPYGAVQKDCLFEVSDSRKGPNIKAGGEERSFCVCVSSGGLKHGLRETPDGENDETRITEGWNRVLGKKGKTLCVRVTLYEPYKVLRDKTRLRFSDFSKRLQGVVFVVCV